MHDSFKQLINGSVVDGSPIYRLRANGPQSLIVDFKKDKDHLVLIHQLSNYLLDKPPQHLINLIPASLSLTLVFDIDVTPDKHWADYLLLAIEHCQNCEIDTKQHRIPVCYDPKLATDSNSVCNILQCNLSQLIEAHSNVTYRVDMLGFLPGFAYLNGLPLALQLPRKSKPALNVPAGSVAIAEQYSAIYPVDSPAGWHVIGRTLFSCFEWRREDFCLFKPLDTVEFVPITFAQWQDKS